MKKLFVGIALIALGIIVKGLAIMILWNWLMPDIFSLTSITLWQGLGLSVLVAVIGLSGKSSTSK